MPTAEQRADAVPAPSPRRRAEPATSSAGDRGERGERGGDPERRAERAGDGVGDGVHQLVARPGHGVVALGAALVELGGEVGHLTPRRLLDRRAQGPRHRQLVAQRQLGRPASSASRRASPARCRPPGSTTAPARSAPSPSTSPAWRAPIDTALARTAGPSAGTAAPSSTSWTRSNPAPQRANATAAIDRLRRRAAGPGRPARRPAAAAPPTATTGAGARPARAARRPCRAAAPLTSTALWIGL